jgi:hypothetical protein
MFDRSVRLADMPAEQRLLNLNMAINAPDRRRRPTRRLAFEMIGMGAAAWAVFATGIWLVS